MLYADQLIAELLDTLRTSALAGNTVVIVAGDHGEEFNDLGLNYWGHNGNFSEYQTHTPFVIYWPGATPRIVEGITSHQDLAPTLMRRVLGCRNDIADYSTGVDLLGDVPADRDLLVESWSRR